MVRAGRAADILPRSVLSGAETRGRPARDLTDIYTQGGVFLITRQQDAFEVRFLSMVAIYSALGVRDAAMNERLPRAFSGMAFLMVRPLRRDVHEPGPACWLHGTGVCLTTE